MLVYGRGKNSQILIYKLFEVNNQLTSLHHNIKVMWIYCLYLQILTTLTYIVIYRVKYHSKKQILDIFASLHFLGWITGCKVFRNKSNFGQNYRIFFENIAKKYI